MIPMFVLFFSVINTFFFYINVFVFAGTYFGSGHILEGLHLLTDWIDLEDSNIVYGGLLFHFL